MKKSMAVTLKALLVALFSLAWGGMDVHAQVGGAGECTLENGNLNVDEAVNISDVVFLLYFLYLGGPAPNPEIVAPIDCLTQAQSDLAAANAALAQTQTDLAACRAELTQTQSDLAAANAALAQAQTDLAACRAELTQTQSDLTACGSDLTACRIRGLPATGQTKCYDDVGGSIACDSAVFPGQDGSYQAGCPTAGRFANNGNGTVTDACTGLMWEKETAPGIFDWKSALLYCERLELAGHTDWRLPNLSELRTLMNYGGLVPTIDPIFQAIAEMYWTSSTYDGDPTHAYTVGFLVGEGNNHEAKIDPFPVRAVRGGL